MYALCARSCLLQGNSVYFPLHTWLRMGNSLLTAGSVRRAQLRMGNSLLTAGSVRHARLRMDNSLLTAGSVRRARLRMGNSLLTAGSVRHAPEVELTFSFHCFVPPCLHQCLPTSTHLSYHVHTLLYHHLCVTMFTSLVHQVHTSVILHPLLYLTTSTSLSDLVHNFVLPYPTFGSPCPHLWLTASTSFSLKSWCHLQHSSDWNSQANIVRRKNPGSLQKFLICATKGENRERTDLSRKDLRNTRKWTTTSRGAWKRLKKNWIGEQCSEIEENLRKNNSKGAYQLVKDLTTLKQGKATTVQDRSGKCLTEKRQILNRWTEYCFELYNHKVNGDPSVLNCPQTDTEDDHPILRREVKAAVQSLKKGKAAGVDNIPAEVVQAGGEDVITTLTTICNKIWQTGEWPTP